MSVRVTVTVTVVATRFVTGSGSMGMFLQGLLVERYDMHVNMELVIYVRCAVVMSKLF